MIYPVSVAFAENPNSNLTDATSITKSVWAGYWHLNEQECISDYFNAQFPYPKRIILNKPLIRQLTQMLN